MKTKIYTSFAMLIISVSLLSSCTSAVTPATNTPIPLTSTSTITPSPAPTSTSTTTPSPTPIPGPWYGIPITTGNVNQVRQLALWGKGLPWISGEHVRAWGELTADTNWTTAYAMQGRVYVVKTTIGVYLYSVDTGKQIAAIDNAVSYAISNDENLIITGHSDGTVKVWNISDGALIGEFQYTLRLKKDLVSIGGQLVPTVGAVAISHDNKMIAAGFADGDVLIWDIGQKNPIQKLDTYGNGVTLFFSHDRGRHYEPEVKTDTNIRGVYNVAFSPDDQYLMIQSFRYLSFWQMRDGKQKWAVFVPSGDFPNPPFSPDGKLFAESPGCAYLWIHDTNNGNIVTNLGFLLKNTCDIKFSFSPNWKQLIVDYLNDENERDIRNMPKGDLVETMPLPVETPPISLFDSGHLWGLKGASALPGKSLLAWGLTDNSIYWWIFPENKHVTYPIEGEDAFFSQDGKYAAVCQNGEIAIFTSDGAYKSILVPGHRTCDGIVFSPDKDTMAVWTKNRIALVSISTGDVQDLKGHQKNVFAVVFSPNGKLLASTAATQPSEMIVWEIKPAKKLISIVNKLDTYYRFFVDFPPYYILEFSPDSTTLATRGYGNPVRLWNVIDGSLAGTIDVIGDRISFSPDGKLVATANRVGIISLWKNPTGEKLAEFRGHVQLYGHSTGINDYDPFLSFPPDGLDVLSPHYEGELGNVHSIIHSVSNLSFLPDGSGLLSVGLDGTIRLWGIDPNISTPVEPPLIPYPIFEYPAEYDVLDYNSTWKFKVYPVANADGYLWSFSQNKTVWENMRDEGKLSGNEYEIPQDSIAHDMFKPGYLYISVRAQINGQWADTRAISITLK